MSRPPAPLPPPLGGDSFSVGDALAAGVSRQRLRASDLGSPFYGVRTPARPQTLLEECRARATRLPIDAAFSHITAARLHALPLPPRLMRESTLHVTVQDGRAPAGARTRGHRSPYHADDVDRRLGVLATTPERTFCDLAGLLSLGQLVAVGDQLIRVGTGLVSKTDLEAAMDRHPGRRGLVRLRRALELLDALAESPKESELRVLIIESGFPEPVCNSRVFDDRHRFVARVDLSYPERKIAIEYEGDHHRDPDQWRKDLARRRRLEALGWTYVSVTQADLNDPRALLEDLRAALSR